MATFPHVLIAPREGGEGAGSPWDRHWPGKKEGALDFVFHQKIGATSPQVSTTWRVQAPETSSSSPSEVSPLSPASSGPLP